MFGNDRAHTERVTREGRTLLLVANPVPSLTPAANAGAFSPRGPVLLVTTVFGTILLTGGRGKLVILGVFV